MEPEHLSFVVAEHGRYFPDGFFARLGPRFLTAYCRTYLNGPHARAYIAEAGGKPVGYLVGVTAPAPHRRHILQAHGRELVLCGVLSLARHPVLALHFLRTRLVRYSRKLMPVRSAQQVPGPAEEAGATAVLAYVAVSEHVRCRGIGTALIQCFVDDAHDAGCQRICLVTAAGAGGAGPYYERLGWLTQGETRTADGRRLAAYELRLRGDRGRRGAECRPA